jgi:hypothetical protein
MAHSIEGSITIIVACIAISLLVLFTVHRFWMPSKRLGHNDAIGPNVSVMGTTYAVIIAFVLSGVWNELQAAMLNTEQEANSVVNLYRFAEQLPPFLRTRSGTLSTRSTIPRSTEQKFSDGFPDRSWASGLLVIQRRVQGKFRTDGESDFLCPRLVPLFFAAESVLAGSEL